MKTIYKGGKVINETKKYILTQPLHSWDMNYRLHELKNSKEFLIDISDVANTQKELDEYGGILFEDLKSLQDVESIKELAWRLM